MRAIAKKTLSAFWIQHSDCEEPLKSWYNEAIAAYWNSPQDIKNDSPSARFLQDNRVLFNIKGNKYRLIGKITCDFEFVWMRFIGNYAEYDEINALTS